MNIAKRSTLRPSRLVGGVVVLAGAGIAAMLLSGRLSVSDLPLASNLLSASQPTPTTVAVPPGRMPSYSQQEHAGPIRINQQQAIAIAMPHPSPGTHLVGVQLTTVGAATTELEGNRPSSLLAGDDVNIWLLKVHFDTPVDYASAAYAPPGGIPQFTDHIFIAVDATTGRILGEGSNTNQIW